MAAKRNSTDDTPASLWRPNKRNRRGEGTESSDILPHKSTSQPNLQNLLKTTTTKQQTKKQRLHRERQRRTKMFSQRLATTDSLTVSWHLRPSQPFGYIGAKGSLAISNTTLKTKSKTNKSLMTQKLWIYVLDFSEDFRRNKSDQINSLYRCSWQILLYVWNEMIGKQWSWKN